MKRKILSIDEYIAEEAMFESVSTEYELLEEAENLREEYKKYFAETLESFGVSSMSELPREQRSEFFGKIKEGWEKGKGRKGAAVSEGELNEKEITSDEQFKEWATAKLKAMHGDNYDEKKATEVIDGLLKKKDDDKLEYGAIVGMLNK